MNKELIHGEPSISLESDLIQLYVTMRGGQIGPVRFRLNEITEVTPYSLPPWKPDEVASGPPVLSVLRGDFFCFPFGESDGYSFPHGVTANKEWSLRHHTPHELEMTMRLDEINGGSITKRVFLKDEQRALYQEHCIVGVVGEFNYGHHPILQIPKGVTCPLRTSPFYFGQVYPGSFCDPSLGETSILKPGATFKDLNHVELASGGSISLSDYPKDMTYEDLVMVTASDESRLGWTAITFPGYVWVALRSVEQFPSTLIWMSNGGRPQAPWLGRHTRRIGIEDVCSHFHDGAHISSQGLLDAKRVRTSKRFRVDEKATLRHVQFVHPVEIQSGLRDIKFLEAGSQLKLCFEDGNALIADIGWKWLIEADK